MALFDLKQNLSEKKDFNRIQIENESLKTKELLFQETLQNLKTNLNNKEKKLANSETELKSLKIKFDKNNAIIHEIDKLKANSIQYMKEISDRYLEINRLNNEIKNKDDEIVELNREKQNIQSNKDETNATIKNLKTTNKGLQNQVMIMKQDLVLREGEIDGLRHRSKRCAIF